MSEQSMVELFCLLVGQGIDAFSVTVAPNAKVQDLKDTISSSPRLPGAIPGHRMRLYQAKQGGVKDAGWLAGESEVTEIADPEQLTETRNTYLKPGLQMGAHFSLQKYFGDQVEQDVVHVLVDVIPTVVKPTFANMSLAAASEPSLPESDLNFKNWDAIKKEIADLPTWTTGAVHEIPAISAFMAPYGGCTNGKIYWREEEAQVLSLLLKNMFAEGHEQTIIHGSPGVGKSTLLCLAMFYVALVLNKHVLMYRLLQTDVQEKCLLYIRHGMKYETAIDADQEESRRLDEDALEDVYYGNREFKDAQAIALYDTLKELKGVSRVMLMLDGFIYKRVPEGLKTFKGLATSQAAILKPQFSPFARKYLHPCWKKDDIFALARNIFQDDDELQEFTEEKLEKRYFYTGGSVREFCGPYDDIEKKMNESINLALELPRGKLFSKTPTGKKNVDRIRRTFVKNKSDPSHYSDIKMWIQLIDSEYALSELAQQISMEDAHTIYSWALSSGVPSLAGCAFELCIHRVAEANQLSFRCTTYPYNKNSGYFWLMMKRGSTLHDGKSNNYTECFEKFLSEDQITYWYPEDAQFPTIDSMFKYEKTIEGTEEKKKIGIAYLQVTTAETHSIDFNKIREFNAIFAEKDLNPIFVVLCPNEDKCESFKLEQKNVVHNVGKICGLFIGHYNYYNQSSDPGIMEVDDGPRQSSHSLNTRSNKRQRPDSTELDSTKQDSYEGDSALSALD